MRIAALAVDAMGGDDAPEPNLAGAHAAARNGIPVVLVGPPDLDGLTADGRPLVGALRVPAALPVPEVAPRTGRPPPADAARP